MNDPLAFLEQRYHVELRRKSPNEYCGPCIFPDCPGGPGDDRFVVWLVGRHGEPTYYCRGCHRRGLVRKLDEEQKPLTKEEQIEWRLKQLERKQEEQEKRLTALEKMAKCTDYLEYHHNISDRGLEYWAREGMTVDMMIKYQLGSCPRCPLWPSLSSYTIPVINSGILENIRHRLETSGNASVPRYLPHMKGLGIQLFNADLIESDAAQRQGLAIVEGSKKAIHVTERVMPTVGIMGAHSFKKEWLTRIVKTVKSVFIILDPDVMERAYRLAAMFGDIARVVQSPCKPDDFFTIHGGTTSDFEYYISQARPIRYGVKR